MVKRFDFLELKTTDRLPSPSGTALAIMKLVQRDDATPQQIVQLMRTDPALSGRVLCFANSAAVGAQRPVVNILDAVMLIGMNAVRNFALSLSLIGKHNTGVCRGFDYAAFWSKSLMQAVSLAAIIARDRTAPPEEAFTLGLLSEIGRLALATAWPDDYSKCLGLAEDSQLLALEQEFFAIDHDSLSLLLLSDWGLPGIFLDAVKLSRKSIDLSDASRTARLARQLSFAGDIADYCLAEESYRTRLLPELEVESSNYAFDRDSLPRFVDQLISQWQEWGKQIEIKTDMRTSAPELKLQSEGPALKGLDILLVDDDPMLLTRLTKQLSEAGHRVEVCSEGDTALQRLIDSNFQVLITDWQMEPLNGLELCRILRASAFGKRLYVVMLTANENEEALVQAFDAGIDDYVVKPINIRVLSARIRAGQRIITLQNELQEERKELEQSSADLAAANRKLQHLAHTDLLTNLPNRRYALIRLDQEREAALRFKRPLSVLMLDIDHFKSVNDTFGHDVGDKALAHTSQVMRETIRTNDVACRLGGEEFLIIAPNTDAAAAFLLAERIRKAIANSQCKDFMLPRSLTVSIGVSCSINGKQNSRELIKLADQAVYRVKEKGRNGVQLAVG